MIQISIIGENFLMRRGNGKDDLDHPYLDVRFKDVFVWKNNW
jgi:hypothetical protein